MYLEYDWTFGVYRPRFGDTFTGIRGVTFYETLAAARKHLESIGLHLAEKTDSRTWRIESLQDNVARESQSLNRRVR
jgi:hypothetical protein